MSAPKSITDTFFPAAGAVPVPGYKLVRLRGRGGFATVWEATDPTGRPVAIKFMSGAVANSHSTSRELRSLQAFQNLEHPHLIRIRQIFSLPRSIAIVMDLADGSLIDLMELYVEEFGRLIDPDRLCLHMVQAAEALDFLNARRHRIDGKLVALQHGDIKPNNILLVGDVAMLADYGLATPTAGPMTAAPRHGTAEYCAPEVFQGFVSDKSDQFSFAVTYFLLRTGEYPFPQPPKDREQLRNYVRDEPDLSALPPAERPAVAKALSVIPQQRFPTCVALMDALLLAQGLRVLRTDDGRMKVRPIPPEDSKAIRFEWQEPEG